MPCCTVSVSSAQSVTLAYSLHGGLERRLRVVKSTCCSIMRTRVQIPALMGLGLTDTWGLQIPGTQAKESESLFWSPLTPAHMCAHMHQHTQTYAYKNKNKIKLKTPWPLSTGLHPHWMMVDYVLPHLNTQIVTGTELGRTVAPICAGWISLNKLLGLPEP